MLAGEYCSRNVIVSGRGDSIVKVAELMRDHHVGDVLVVDANNGDQIPVGIITDRDIVIEVIAADVDIHELVVEDIMNYKLITALDTDDLMTVIKRMRAYGIRRIPVINQAGYVVGMLSTDDIIDVIAEQLIDVEQIFENEQSRERKNRLAFQKH